jgi:hypothetical protein
MTPDEYNALPTIGGDSRQGAENNEFRYRSYITDFQC